MEYLVETALLTHGLKSIENEGIRNIWTNIKKNIVWVSAGKIVIGNIEEYLEFRKEAEKVIRIDSENLERAFDDNESGALTASGTMSVCEKLGIRLAVTCGMGGIGNIKGEELCPDLPALAQIPVVLISAGPKDMLERKQTIEWLCTHGVKVVGTKRDYCTGYIFTRESVKLQGIYEKDKEWKAPLLIINEIPEKQRVTNHGILDEAVLQGILAEQQGRYYHPAVNEKIDELTGGHSSRIQLESLFANTCLAEEL